MDEMKGNDMTNDHRTPGHVACEAALDKGSYEKVSSAGRATWDRVAAAVLAHAKTEPAEAPGYSADGGPVVGYAVVVDEHDNQIHIGGAVIGFGLTQSAAWDDYTRRMKTMSEDRIKVTVTAPKGKRANVVMRDHEHAQCATVLSGQTQDFFVDRVRGIQINEVEETRRDIPHHNV